MVAAEALEREDAACPQRGDDLLKRVGHLQSPPLGVQEGKRRAARRTGDRLGVEPTIPDILVLFPAGGAHRERGHGRALAVVRQRSNDGVAGPARGAVEEWVAVTSGGGVMHFPAPR